MNNIETLRKLGESTRSQASTSTEAALQLIRTLDELPQRVATELSQPLQSHLERQQAETQQLIEAMLRLPCELQESLRDHLAQTRHSSRQLTESMVIFVNELETRLHPHLARVENSAQRLTKAVGDLPYRLDDRLRRADEKAMAIIQSCDDLRTQLRETTAKNLQSRTTPLKLVGLLILTLISLFGWTIWTMTTETKNAAIVREVESRFRQTAKGMEMWEEVQRTAAENRSRSHLERLFED